MTREQARDILLLYRPGTSDAQDPEVEAALALSRRDPELAAWLEQHQAFQLAMRGKLRQLRAPPHLRAALLAHHNKVIRPAFWRQPPLWLAAAAAVLLGLALIVFRPGGGVADRFTNYQQMMVSKALRGYSMDWSTSDMNQLRGRLAEAQAPAQFPLPKGVAGLKLTGGAHLTWRTHPVAMVCFKRPDKADVWLFVMKRSALKDPPPPSPKLERVDRLMTATWTKGDETFVLAGPPEPGFLEQYF